jgi:hypothetical protein
MSDSHPTALTRPFNTFTAEERATVARRYRAGEPSTKLGREYRVHPVTVFRLIKLADLETRGEPTPLQAKREAMVRRRLEMAEQYRQGMSGPQIAELHGVTDPCVYEALRACGVVVDYYREVNHDYFEAVDCEEKAYWLGVLAADGCVCRRDKDGTRSPTISLDLATRDREHVEWFRRCVGSTHTVYVRNPKKTKWGNSTGTASIQFRSKKMADDLAKLGIVPRKSLTAEPWDGPPELMRHYWRGVVDGDGCLSFVAGRWVVHLVGSRLMVAAFLAFAKGVTTTKANANRHGLIWQTAVYGRNAPPLITALYERANYALSRKAIKASQAINYYKSKNITF